MSRYRYIDADALKKRVSELIVPDWTRTLIRSWLDSEPTVDAVPVVRCKDCKHRVVNEHYGKKGYFDLKAFCELDTGDIFELGRDAEKDDWFCADGERRDDGR